VITPYPDATGGPPRKMPAATDMHAGESETSMSMAARPDLVHLDRAGQQSGADMARLHLPDDVYTAIWWYARFPNHYAGNGAAATLELGQYEAKGSIAAVVRAIQAIKADNVSLKLQNEFFEKAKHPLETRP